MAAGKHRHTGIVAAGYRASWTGDLADDVANLPAVGCPETRVGAAPTLADGKARAAEKHIACSPPTITRKLLADVLAGLQRLLKAREDGTPRVSQFSALHTRR
ncbi:hypothetical protein [Saccharopolyspora shandongensis]|uniref:hypothetical protein n=1 Tax=Saccharopolyspora shandongensis TaxID=418495 RepID=UPI00115F7B82|nr:hypothetical protein [Saccharopolyspora shandongensis]